ncbi:biotin carboxylase N-terminal domain-containing protein [Chitinivorax sp. B]|uniref:acetyl/propionyl/methylcrotonyl-CoA carboxylase subunit alpha n=1 Tax=Chitinivorax sp. B TaxID=2502235 RepID=UPI0010F75252|nr:biotin carboxylase N-terminal domain-containing protein [Chitinivorax sp. B]
MFQRLLIANRGEIACRIIATAQRMGYHTIAVYSDADRQARHVQLADEAVHIGPSPVGESYLSIPRLLAACQVSQAQAVHPGYGFLSENAEFAQACADAGLVFIGPRPDAIHLMGNKRQAKLAMLQAGVSCVPGYEGSDQSDDALCQHADRIGFPVMIKAAAGGGGRGMRLVERGGDLLDGLRSARSEALHAFGSQELILERAILNPRHVEFQILADQHGQVLHLGERDCSIQRRHQKVLEESPCPVMNPTLRQRMGEAAVAAARACGYVGAGTVEFLLAADQQFYFLEMNTRLQVEHPVTELVTGLDLVEWQLRVASGEALPWQQSDIALHGHAIEVRLYAEDPRQQFLPQTGPILAWQPANDVRIDHGVQVGDCISPYYDPMIAKVIAHGTTRQDAARRLIRALDHTALLGVLHNQQFLADLLRHPAFLAGETHTGFIDQQQAGLPSLLPAIPDYLDRALAAALLHTSAANSRVAADWGRQHLGPQPLMLRMGDQIYTLLIQVDGNRLAISDPQFSDQRCELTLLEMANGCCTYQIGPRRLCAHFALIDGSLYLATARGQLIVDDVTHAPPPRQAAAGNGVLLAPMDGAIVDIRVAVGDKVAAGQLLMVLEAMKIEHQLKVDCAGVVGELLAGKGQQVKRRQRLAVIA